MDEECTISGKVQCAKGIKKVSGIPLKITTSRRIFHETKTGRDGSFTFRGLGREQYNIFMDSIDKDIPYVSNVITIDTKEKNQVTANPEIVPGVLKEEKTFSVWNKKLYHDLIVAVYFRNIFLGFTKSDKNGSYSFHVPGNESDKEYYTNVIYPKEVIDSGKSVSGTVTKPDGRPAPKTLILMSDIMQMPILYTYTDENGFYSIENPQGIANSQAELIALEPDGKLIGRAQLLFQSKAPLKIDIKMEFHEKVGVTGKIVDEKGNPLPGESLICKTMGKPEGTFYNSMYRTIVSDERGEFRIDGLLEGLSYELGFNYNSPETAFVAGVKTDPLIMVKKKEKNWIAGVVLDSDGKPLPKYRIQIDDTYYPQDVLTDSNGHFRADKIVAPDKIKRIWVNIPNKETPKTYKNLDNETPIIYENLAVNKEHTIIVKKGKNELGGKFVYEDGAPADGELYLSLDYHSGFRSVGTEKRVKFTGNSFRFNDLREDSYIVSIMGENVISFDFNDIKTGRTDYVFNVHRPPKITMDIINDKSPESFAAAVYDGKSPISIDGDVSEWVGIPSYQMTLKFRYPKGFEGRVDRYIPKDENDFSAKARICFDSNNLYLETEVKDDEIVGGAKPWFFIFDSVSIDFYGKKTKNNNQPVSVAFLVRKDGTVLPGVNTFGSEYPFSTYYLNYHIPEKIGLKSNVKIVKGGYSVEVAIPLEYIYFMVGKIEGINIRVLDFDTENGYMNKNYTFCSAYNGKKDYMSIEAIDPASGGKSEIPIAAVPGGIVYDFLETCGKNSAAAEKMILKYGNEMWAMSLQCDLYNKSGLKEKELEILDKMVKKEHDRDLAIKEINSLYNITRILYLEQDNFGKARKYLDTILSRQDIVNPVLIKEINSLGADLKAH